MSSRVGRLSLSSGILSSPNSSGILSAHEGRHSSAIQWDAKQHLTKVPNRPLLWKVWRRHDRLEDQAGRSRGAIIETGQPHQRPDAIHEVAIACRTHGWLALLRLIS